MSLLRRVLLLLLLLPMLSWGQGHPINGNITLYGTQNYCRQTGAATDTYACAIDPAIPGYNRGTLYMFETDLANTGAASINFNSKGAVAITKKQNGASVDLADGDIPANSLALLYYDGTTMQLLSTTVVGPKLIASGTKALATSAIPSGTCTAAQTATATGTVTTDLVLASLNGDVTGVTGYTADTGGTLRIDVYPTADTMNFKVCNATQASITPGAVTVNWRVLR
jgi:hypothetical protein